MEFTSSLNDKQNFRINYKKKFYLIAISFRLFPFLFLAGGGKVCGEVSKISSSAQDSRVLDPISSVASLDEPFWSAEGLEPFLSAKGLDESLCSSAGFDEP